MNGYASERTLKKIDKVTSSMMSSGLYQFYISFAEYKQKLAERVKSAQDEDDNFRALTMDQLKRPMLFIFGLWSLAVVIFIMEHIISKWKHWRGCRIEYLDPKFEPKRNRKCHHQSKQKRSQRIIGIFKRKRNSKRCWTETRPKILLCCNLFASKWHRKWISVCICYFPVYLIK